jgi:hypothetical protein
MRRFAIGGLAVLLLAVMMPLMATGDAFAAPPPRPPETAANESGQLDKMLSLLPALPLGGEAGGQITFADIAGQMKALGLPASPTPEEAAIRNQALLSVGTLPQQYPSMQAPEWEEAFGFQFSQIDQTLEYAAPPLVVGVLIGQFDQSALRQAWDTAGYKAVTADGTTYYSVRDDYEFDFSDPVGRLAMATFNNIALLDDQTLIYSSAHKGIEGVIQARAGQGNAMADDISIAPMLASLPADLTSALIVHGSTLVAMQDPLATVNEMMTPGADMGAIATKTAQQTADAKQMPPIAAALIGATAGGPIPARRGEATPTPTANDIPTATQIVAVTTISHEAAEAAVPVIEQRLATQRPPSLPPDGDTFATLYPERSVTAVPDQPVVLVELHPAPDVPRNSLVNFFFQRALTFVAWSL